MLLGINKQKHTGLHLFQHPILLMNGKERPLPLRQLSNASSSDVTVIT